MTRLRIVLSAGIGALACVLADLGQKAEASSVLNIANNLELHLGIPLAPVMTSLVVIFIAVSLCFVFEVETKQKAFYSGASILAVMMTLVPYRMPDGFKTTPNSVEVVLTVQTEDGRPVKGALVTLWKGQSKEIVARSKLSHSEFRFYQAGGDYRVSVEMPGYRRVFHRLQLREGDPASRVQLTLRPTVLPLFVQRAMGQ